jgi:hypothetical protein
MARATTEFLARESADWFHRGLIDRATADQLGKRYDRQGTMLSGLVAWLGLAAIFLLGLAVLTAIGLMSGSPALGGVMLGGVAVGLWLGGIRMAVDPAQRHPVTGSALVTIGLAAAYGAMTLVVLSASDEFTTWSVPVLLIVTGVLAAATAYGYHLRWPLLLALLCFFHGLGAWHEYVGHGEYVADIQDPRLMALVAAACAGFGFWHQRAEEGQLARYAGFGRLFAVFGLLYLDCSLWFLGLGFEGGVEPVIWIALFTAAALGQIVLGARLKDGMPTGFGIVFLGIDLYTRFFEHFWDSLSAGSFFLIGGLIGIALGVVFEAQARQAAP